MPVLLFLHPNHNPNPWTVRYVICIQFLSSIFLFSFVSLMIDNGRETIVREIIKWNSWTVFFQWYSALQQRIEHCEWPLAHQVTKAPINSWAIYRGFTRNMDQLHIPYSLKATAQPPRNLYQKLLVKSVADFMTNLRWKVTSILNPFKSNKKTFGFKTSNSPPFVP